MGAKSQVESAPQRAGTVFPGKAVTHCVHYSCYSNTRGGGVDIWQQGGRVPSREPRNFPKCTRESSPKCSVLMVKRNGTLIH